MMPISILSAHLNLKFMGALTDDPHVSPTVAQIKYLQDHRPQRKMCLLAEGHASENQYRKLESGSCSSMSMKA